VDEAQGGKPDFVKTLRHHKRRDCRSCQEFEKAYSEVGKLWRPEKGKLAGAKAVNEAIALTAIN